MTHYQDMAEAYLIFDKYPGDQSTATGHDQIWAGPNASTVSPEDNALLEELGWAPDDDTWLFLV